MINVSDSFAKAVVADAREMYIKAILDIIDPEVTYGAVASSGERPYSQPELLYSKHLVEPPKYTTGEKNRWLLDSSWPLMPDNPDDVIGEQFFIGNYLCGADGSFASPVWVQENFSNVSILQAFSIYMPTLSYDGVPEDFTVEVYQGSTAYYSKTVTGNTESALYFEGFTVYNPTGIRVTVTKWSLPGRYFRMIGIMPGLYEEWDNDYISTLSITQEVDVACVKLPYGSCTLAMNNISRRFEPRNKNGMFLSIQERQAIPVNIGVGLPDGSSEYVQVGIYYQISGGWTTGDNGLTFTWNLVDVIGLLANRTYVVPSTLPTTLEGWISSVVSQLGPHFDGKYIIADGYVSTALTCTSDKIANAKCADIVLWVCQAAGVFARADNETGKLAIEPMWSSGDYVTLDNMSSYPVMKANEDISSIIFTLNDGNDTTYVVGGNNSAASSNVTISNPFIKNQAQANTCAKNILSAYGGNLIDVTSRGNPKSEPGDVGKIQLDESTAISARLISHNLGFTDGIMANLTSTYLQADGGLLYDAFEIITANGTWQAPNGVTSIKFIIVGSGTNGSAGENGGWGGGELSPGTDGLGGKVYASTISVNNQQEFAVAIGTGGQDTTFGPYSSASGQRFNGYADVKSGSVYARDGVKVPLANSGDGGAGGAPGSNGVTVTQDVYDSEGEKVGEYTYNAAYPTNGKSGAIGGSGCVVAYWDKSQVIT